MIVIIAVAVLPGSNADVTRIVSDLTVSLIEIFRTPVSEIVVSSCKLISSMDQITVCGAL